MSRAVFYDVHGQSAGEVHGFFNRGWTLVGDAAVKSGAQTAMNLSAAQASLAWLQLGKLVLVEHDRLPAWAGMLDAPWTALLPAGLTIYNIEYLLDQRVPDAAVKLTGSTGEIVSQMIQMINGQEETYLRPGDVDADASKTATLDQRGFWAQLTALIEASGMEMAIRPAVVSGQLFLYMDIKQRIGIDTGFLFHDGPNANMLVIKADVVGPIYNRVIGINDKSAAAGRLATEPQIDEDSIRNYRLRSTVKQFSGIADQSTLLQYTQNYLAVASRPLLTMNLNVEDKGEAFHHLGVGNSAIFHASNLYLPGGQKGYQGTLRMKVIAYDESANTVGMTVQGIL